MIYFMKSHMFVFFVSNMEKKKRRMTCLRLGLLRTGIILILPGFGIEEKDMRFWIAFVEYHGYRIWRGINAGEKILQNTEF